MGDQAKEQVERENQGLRDRVVQLEQQVADLQAQQAGDAANQQDQPAQPEQPADPNAPQA